MLRSLTTLEFEPARSREGADARLDKSPSSEDLTRSRALSSEGRRRCCGIAGTGGTVEGVVGAALDREGVEAADELDVVGEGGPSEAFRFALRLVVLTDKAASRA